MRTWCADRVEPALLADAELLVSELAASAILHGHGRITLRARLDEDRLSVGVVDRGSGLELDLRHDGIEQVDGLGLDLVDELASRWGVHAGHVWSELDLPPRRDCADADADAGLTPRGAGGAYRALGA